MKKDIAIYFRAANIDEENEYLSCSKYFNTFNIRTALPKESLIIPRYSALPFYKELEKEVQYIGSSLINSYSQHMFTANIWNYYQYIEDITPKTYNNWINLKQGSYIVKGITNSRKHEWNRRMFAKTKEDIPSIANNLLDDDLIKSQGLVIREYVPLKTFSIGINDLPITNEWRFFCLHSKIIIGGYYWSYCIDESITDPMNPPNDAIKLVKEVCDRIGEYIPFFVIDVAEKQDGGWIVIELNDGQQSGLCSIDSDKFYKTLKDKIDKHNIL